MKADSKRSQLWVDPGFQSRLLLRLVCYFVLFSFVVIHIGFVFQAMLEVGANGFRGIYELYWDYLGKQAPLLYSLVLITPILLYDLLKFSHRIAGPLFRCRRAMQQMAEGKPVAEFKPRKRDLMRELFQAFNALIKDWNPRAPPPLTPPAPPPAPPAPPPPH